MTHRLLVATPLALLDIELTDAFELQRKRELLTGFGVYYGLTRDGRALYVAARNVDFEGCVFEERRPGNTIWRYSWPWNGIDGLPVASGFKDLHEIRFRDGLLWVLSMKVPELHAIDARSGEEVGSVALSALVPKELRHEPLPDAPDDPYHMNSLHFSGDRLFVLAHNGAHPSFVMEFRFSSAKAFLGQPELVAVHETDARHAHCVFADHDGLVVLDSRGGRVRRSDGTMTQIHTPDAPEGFLRGMGVGRDHLFVGDGAFSTDREARHHGPTTIHALSRDSLAPLGTVEIGHHGVATEVMLVSEQDERDAAKAATGRPWLSRCSGVLGHASGHRAGELAMADEALSIRHERISERTIQADGVGVLRLDGQPYLSRASQACEPV